MSVAVFVSGHGLGHAAREAQILSHLPADIPVTVVTRSPEWFWRERFADRFALVPDAYDVGCVQTTSLEVDVAATREAAAAVRAANRERRDALAEALTRWGTRVVVADVAAFPLTVASDLGIASVCVANFTWADIYAGLPGMADEAAAQARDLKRADLLLEAGLALPMPEFARRESVGIVAARGTDRRGALEARLPESVRGRRLALVYPGGWGTPLRWDRLARLSDWCFLTLLPPDPCPVGVVPIERGWMPHADLVASVDLVVSKAGYGIVGECLAAGTPLLYGPRDGFAEFAALDAALRAWPGGLRVEADAFLATDWDDALARVSRQTPVPTPGGPKAAARIAALWQERG